MSWLSDEPDHRDLGFRLSGLPPARTGGPRLSFDASWHDRRYTGRRGLDGPVVDAAAGIGWAATADDPPGCGGGVGTAENETGEPAQFVPLDPGGRRPTLLPWGFTVGGSGTVRWTGYEGNWAPFVLGRRGA